MMRLPSIYLLIILIYGCRQRDITHSDDYSAFLNGKHAIHQQLDEINNEIGFWQNRLQQNPESFVDMGKMGSQFARRFEITGDVNDLIRADSFFLAAVQKINFTEPEFLFPLSQNAIRQHQFRRAWDYLQMADSIGVNPYILHLLQFDAAMEIGLYEFASSCLNQLKDKNSFDYLIRMAKLEDHRGNLDQAIVLMEQALSVAAEDEKEDRTLWAQSNLADMYGHAGKIRNAYSNYLEVLKRDSTYLYALKGIAWIAWSHDKNTKEAKRIIQYILSQTDMPDLYLLLSDIESWEGNQQLSDQYIDHFLSEAEKPKYDRMYNKYLIQVFAEKETSLQKALQIAETEVQERPTPETFSWLAGVYLKMGQYEKAMQIIYRHVLQKSAEPETLLCSARILAANGKNKEARMLYKECLDASFELGPLTADEIHKAL